MRKNSGNQKKNEPPVDQYRKEIGHHQEIVEKPSNIKKRLEKKIKSREEPSLGTEETIDSGTNYTKLLYMIIMWTVLIAGIYYLFQYLNKPREHPFAGNNGN